VAGWKTKFKKKKKTYKTNCSFVFFFYNDRYYRPPKYWLFTWICTYVRIKSCQPNYFAMNFVWWSSRLVDSSLMKLALRFYCNSWLNGICNVVYPYDWEKQLVPGSDSNITGYIVQHLRNWRHKISLQPTNCTNLKILNTHVSATVFSHLQGVIVPEDVNSKVTCTGRSI